MSSFRDFFSTATGYEPYGYQEELAGSGCVSRLISVPTGLGKTAAVVMAWLWNRVHLKSEKWPRRLVYCLPMRTLVEQTRDAAKGWIDELAKAGLLSGKPPKVVVLMGGEALEGEEKDWDLYPEDDTILIGTQDMLLSRALNRGYGMSRYRWPMHFGLLNNDCLWVLDETQLMGVGVETSAQLDGFRHFQQWVRETPCPTWWMSATLEDARLATVDHPPPEGGWPRLLLGDEDRALPQVQARLHAVKRLHKAEVVLSKQIRAEQYARDLAALIMQKHVPGQLTLAVINRVQRAQEIFQALKKAGRTEGVALVHSRFREPERRDQQQILTHGQGDRIVIATQAVEAGVDVSARVLFTELAPWASLVQRFGRCNRGGEFNAEGADVFWIDVNFDDNKETAPYLPVELADARAELEKLTGASAAPATVGGIQVIPPTAIRPVIRRKDLVDLFDTTPDIAGQDLDVSRYIRDGEETDVQVFWRNLSQCHSGPANEAGEARRSELCKVPHAAFKSFREKLKKADDERDIFTWDGLNGQWVPATFVRPGAVYLIDHRAGGYEPQLGWTGVIAMLKKEVQWVPPVAVDAGPIPDSVPFDPLTHLGVALTLDAHTQHVVEEMQKLVQALQVSADLGSALKTAGRWHDVGKALTEFQALLRRAAGANAPEGLLAKSGKIGGKGDEWPAWRKHYRHELASALAWLAHCEGADQCDLIAYLIAAHHGKVRLSIRSLPDEQPPPDRSTALMARGVVEGDELPPIQLDGLNMPATTLNLELMKMGSDEKGRPSWLARMIDLRDRLGPFRLAYLETLLRAADMRASAAEAANGAALVRARKM
jgi:CRISPR-associated endonuclease/helicase Cas3